MEASPSIYGVYDRNERLVLILSDEPGEFNFARLPEDDLEVPCAFATLQCFAEGHEGDLLAILKASADLEGFLARLAEAGYRVRPGRPKVGGLARL
jgi:hypothetical protein